MDILQYVLSQSIGIFYKNSDWMEDIFYKIKDFYTMEFIQYITNSKNGGKILLKDGTSITFVNADTNSHGGCFSKIILEPGINEEIIKARILPQLKHQNRRAMIIKENTVETV